MNAKDLLKQAKELLKAAKADPKQFEVLDKATAAPPPPAAPKARYGQNTKPTKPMPPMPKPSAPPMKAPSLSPAKPMMKDDQPHAPNSPKDKAHDVAEHMDHMKHALTILNTPEKQKQMLAHLKTLHEPSQLRSPANQHAGMAPGEKHHAPQMNKAELLTQAKMLLKAAQEDPKQFETLKKEEVVNTHGEKSQPEKPLQHKKAEPGMISSDAGKSKAASAKAAVSSYKNENCSYKMSKAEIKEDMKKEWKPKFKKDY